MNFYLMFIVFFLITICNAQLPHTFTQTARIDNGGSALGVTVDSNGKIYLANAEDGIRIYNYDGMSFTNTAHINLGGVAHSVAIDPNGTIFLANGNDGLRMYCNDSTYVAATTNTEDEIFSKSVVINSDGIVFLANGADGLRAYSYDCSTITNVSHIDDGGRALCVTIGPDGTIFLANSYGGLRAYSFDGSSFTNTAYIDNGGNANGVAVDVNGNVFLANGTDGLRAYIYDGKSFTNTAHAEIDKGELYGVAVDSDGTIFAANTGLSGFTRIWPDDGLRAYSYDGTSFTNTAHIDDDGFAMAVALNSDGTVFLANGEEGLIAYTYSGYTGILDEFSNSPYKYELSQNYPNPFNPTTKIKYDLPKSVKVKIEVFNLLGQKIETLINKPMPAGSHKVEFTAKDLPSGVYLYRIEAGEFQQVKKMILLR